MAGAAAFMMVSGAALADEPDKSMQDYYKHPTLASSSQEDVSIQLVLAMDTSGSMSNEEYQIQLQATAYALNSELVRSAIKYKTNGNTVAISVIDFESQAQFRIGWVDIRGDEINDKPYRPGEAESSARPDKLDALAHEIAEMPRLRSGGTSIDTALELSRRLYLACPWAATERRVLDVFGDGSSTYNYIMEKRRDELAAMGVTINAFAIVNDEPNLEAYFRDKLITREFIQGPGSLYSEPGRVWAVARNLRASDNRPAGLRSFFGEVAQGMKQKISVEVAGPDGYARALGITGETLPPVPPRVG